MNVHVMNYSGMTLAEFLRLNDLTHEAFARKSGVPRPTITRLVKSGSRPSWAHIEKINTATGGKVAPNDWFIGKAKVSA